ncbi:hypothetical protein IKG20_00805 [Candidatus Saccharibacteria bacterium]|nr:hypothetical protein [Candidatus Saccharibacteria bacterium]
MDQKPQETPGITPEIITNPTPITANITQHKNDNAMKYGMIACVTIALIGIGFGIYGMLQSFAKDKTISELKQLVAEINTDDSKKTNKNGSGSGTIDPSSSDTDPSSSDADLNNNETVAKKAEDDMKDGDSISIADAQVFLNDKLQLPLHSFVFVSTYGVNYANNLFKYESGRATLIQSLAGKQGLAQETKGETCQKGAYITAETYGEIYKKVFGRSFEYQENTKYGELGQFKNAPCTCNCAEEETENGFYVWNNTYSPYPEISFIVEKVEGNAISGILARGDSGEAKPDMEIKGNFTVEYGHNDSGYFIIDLSLTE